MQKNHFLLLKKSKNTESAQLWSLKLRARCSLLDPCSQTDGNSWQISMQITCMPACELTCLLGRQKLVIQPSEPTYISDSIAISNHLRAMESARAPLNLTQLRTIKLTL